MLWECRGRRVYKKVHSGVREDDRSEQKESIDFDLLFYLYCVVMQRSSREFYESTLAHIYKQIHIKFPNKKEREDDIECESLDDFLS